MSKTLTSKQYDSLITNPANDFAATVQLTPEQLDILNFTGMSNADIERTIEDLQDAAFEAVKDHIQKTVFARFNIKD
jgi:hypothetical protein